MIKLLQTIVLSFFISLTAFAESFPMISWGDLTDTEMKIDAIIEELGITDFEMLDQYDPKFVELMDRVREMGAKAQPLAKWDKQPVTIEGYITPLSFEEEGFTEFLVVPYQGACIHVPAPPANQLIYVNLKEPIPLEYYYGGITVSGHLHADRIDTEFASAAYRMDVDEVQPLDLY